MKCSECTENLYLLFDNSNDALAAELKQHMANCPACYAEYEAMTDVATLLQPKVTIKAPASLKEIVLRQIETPEAVPQPAKRVRITPLWKKISVAAAVILMVLVTPFLFKHGSGEAKASDLIMVAINAGRNVQNFVMQFSVRTKDSDDFEYIDPNGPMVPHTLMRSFTAPNAWRIHKPGRQVVFNGTDQYLYIPAGKVVFKGDEQAGFVSWMRLLLDPESILWKEKDNAESIGAAVKTFEKNGDTCLTITTKASGNFINDFLRNESIGTADSRREYVFDSKTHLLKGLKIYLIDGEKETLIFSLDTITYNIAIPAEALSFTVPADAEVKTAKEIIPLLPDATAGSSSRQTARTALEDLSKGDFETHKQLWSEYSRFSLSILHKGYEGIQVVRTGEPFHSVSVSGDVVPYEIKFPNGYIKKFWLILDNRNPVKAWVVKGGL
jgi:outer membrane lipoprotein-sorting protein